MDPVRRSRATYSDNASTRQAAGRRSFAGSLRSLTASRTRLQTSTCRPRTYSFSESLDQHVLPDEALDMERNVRVQQWKTLARARPLKFLVAGRGGVGKSSLVNNLLELDRSGEEGAKEGFTGRATTQAVSKHTGSKHGIEVIAYDTPGFQDLTLREEDIIAELVDTTDSTVDVCLYCASLETRISEEDRRICSLLTNAFKPTLWEKAIFVLTFANSVSTKVDKCDYDAIVDCYKTSLQQCLTRAGVPTDKIHSIPFCTAGYTDPQLMCEGCNNWQDRLYVEIIKRADPEVTPALLKLRWGSGAVSYAVSENFYKYMLAYTRIHACICMHAV